MHDAEHMHSSLFNAVFVSYLDMTCMVDSGSSARATQPFPFVSTTTRCLSLSRSVAAAGGGNLPPLMMPLRDDQYISLSPTDSPAEDAEMDTGAASHCQTAQVDGQQVGKGLTRLPADTPRTPGPKGVNFQQFCDQLRTDLPGDSQGRRSFDTRTRFVAGDPGARFGSAAPLEYEVTGGIGRPHWELIFEHVLRQCGYLTDFHTCVDNRDLANHQRQDPSLPHWPAAARWWHSRLKLMGPHKEKTELYSSPFLNLRGCIMYTPPGLAPLFWLPWWLYFLGSTSSCWIVTAYRLPCLKLKTCGQRPTWRVFQPIVRVAFHRHTLYEPSHVTAKIFRLSTHNLGLVVLEWVKRLWLSQNHMRNSTLGSL